MRKDKSPMTLAEVFNLCQDIELRHAKLYATLSLLLGNVDERVARFWEQMSTEEWQHYILVDFGRALCVDIYGSKKEISPNDTNETSDLPPFPDISIKRITDALELHEKRIESGRISLDEAFEIAIAIEGSEADTIYMYLLSIIRQAIRESKQPYLLTRIVQIERDMVSHVDGLIKATQQFSKDTALIRKAHRLKEEHI